MKKLTAIQSAAAICALQLGFTLFSHEALCGKESATPTEIEEKHPPQNSVYKSVGKSGKIVFSDKPGKNSEKVDTTPQNLHQSTQNIEKGKIKREHKEEPQIPYSILLTSPSNGYQLGPGEQELVIAVEVMPTIDDLHFVQFFVDGQPTSPPSKSLSTSVPMGITMRGQRQVSAILIDSNGQTVSSTYPATIYVIRPNSLRK